MAPAMGDQVKVWLEPPNVAPGVGVDSVAPETAVKVDSVYAVTPLKLV